jgi:hypothetical protein
MIAANLERVKATPQWWLRQYQSGRDGSGMFKAGKGAGCRATKEGSSPWFAFKNRADLVALWLARDFDDRKRHSKLQPSPIRLRRLTVDLYYHCVSIAGKETKALFEDPTGALRRPTYVLPIRLRTTMLMPMPMPMPILRKAVDLTSVSNT